MKDYARRMQKLKDIFNLPETSKMTRVSENCFNGLKTLFPNHEWEFKDTRCDGKIMILCDSILIFNGSLDDVSYRQDIITFTENFILEEKLELLFKDTQHV